jgi:endo-1,4-beta-mannosidase
LFRTNNLRVHDVYAETDLAVMHAYPMYVSWMQNPLDPDYVPFTCAMVTALSGKPALMEEFGGCTAPPGAPSQTWSWTSYGKPRTQFMASEEDLADYYAKVLPNLVDVGASGAMLWCWADYSSELWSQPPCDEAWHERFFGMVRPDGTLKPHAEVIRRFAATKPVVKPATRPVRLGMSAEEFYADSGTLMQTLFAQFAGADRIKR